MAIPTTSGKYLYIQLYTCNTSKWFHKFTLKRPGDETRWKQCDRTWHGRELNTLFIAPDIDMEWHGMTWTCRTCELHELPGTMDFEKVKKPVMEKQQTNIRTKSMEVDAAQLAQLITRKPHMTCLKPLQLVTSLKSLFWMVAKICQDSPRLSRETWRDRFLLPMFKTVARSKVKVGCNVPCKFWGSKGKAASHAGYLRRLTQPWLSSCFVDVFCFRWFPWTLRFYCLLEELDRPFCHKQILFTPSSESI